MKLKKSYFIFFKLLPFASMLGIENLSSIYLKNYGGYELQIWSAVIWSFLIDKLMVGGHSVLV